MHTIFFRRCVKIVENYLAIC